MTGTKYIFFLDLDGTLYCDGEIPERNRIAAEKAQKAGHRIYLNTGRAKGIIPSNVKDFPFDGRVTALGSNVYAGSKKIHGATLDNRRLAEIFRQYDESGRKILFEGEDDVIVNRSYEFCGYENIHVAASADEFLEKYGKNSYPKIFLPYVLDEAEAEIYRNEFNFCQHPTYVEISPKCDDKATGMKYVTDFYLPEEYKTVAMGDSLNDIDMLESADIAVAMGDSHHDILPVCDIVTCAGRDGGVAEAIYRITGIEE